MLTVPPSSLLNQGLKVAKDVYYQCSSDELVADTIRRGQGVLNDTGALVIKTGEFTGRSPRDKFIVEDEITRSAVNWNEFNIPIEAKYFDQLHGRMMAYLEDKEVWVRD
jgi:phosphoenolpyruvate carboxykinase (ATP)